eukprot:366577-Chlamydomonas_euryale.AAC.22
MACCSTGRARRRGGSRARRRSGRQWGRWPGGTAGRAPFPGAPTLADAPLEGSRVPGSPGG